MTIIDEILISANQLANAGTKPTVALVKAKLSQRAPLITIISTLKNWQHQPDFIAPINDAEPQVNQDASTENNSALVDSLLENGEINKIIQQLVTLELTAIKTELSDMKLQINQLADQLNKN